MSEPATPLPWEKTSSENVYGERDGAACIVVMTDGTSDRKKAGADAAYIVEACNAYPDLRSLNDALKEALRDIEACQDHFYTEDRDKAAHLPAALLPWAGPLRVIFDECRDALATYDKAPG